MRFPPNIANCCAYAKEWYIFVFIKELLNMISLIVSTDEPKEKQHEFVDYLLWIEDCIEKTF